MSSSQILQQLCFGRKQNSKEQLTEVETVRITIYNYLKPYDNGVINEGFLYSHGTMWSITVSPCAEEIDLESMLGTVSCSLSHRRAVNEGRRIEPLSVYFRHRESSSERACWNGRSFCAFIDEVKIEHDGSLVLECDIEVDIKRNKRVWYPKELQRNDTLVALYDNASSNTSDTIFSVEEATYRVHKNILALQAKKLHDLCRDYENDTPIPIIGTRNEIFKAILDFMYHVKTPEIENEDIAREILVAADRYQCVHLKLYIESVLVDKFLSVKSAASLFIFADSFFCALLKEAASKLFAKYADQVKRTEAWAQITESKKLLIDLLDSTATEVSCYDRKSVTVSTLREELKEANLDLDGSRETLVKRLETHRKLKRRREN